MRVARLLLCYVLLEDYSTNLGGAAITSDAARQDASATNPTLPGIYMLVPIYRKALFSFSNACHRLTENRQKADRKPTENRTNLGVDAADIARCTRRDVFNAAHFRSRRYE